MKDHAVTAAKHTADWLSLGVLAGTLIDVLPAVAACFTIIWTAIRIYETSTVRAWMKRPPKDKPSAE